jgi:hypothetical protein
METLMSKGPGRLERAIRQLFADKPGRALITDELVERCYPDARPFEKKHTVAVLRAAHKVVASDPNWQEWEIGGGRNVGLVFVNMDNIESYALGRLISGDFVSAWRRPSEWRVEEYKNLRVKLDTEDHRRLMAPGAAWHRFVEIHRAERDGDTARAIRLKAEAEGELRQLTSRIKAASVVDVSCPACVRLLPGK